MEFAEQTRRMAAAVAALSMDAVERAKSGHPGMPMGMAETATALFTRHVRFDAGMPDWPDRDRFVLSAGHGSMLQYSLLYLLGYPGMEIEDLENFRQLGAKTAGHPEYGHAPGIETTTGPLGQGLGAAVGMAMAEAHLSARFGADLVDHRVWTIAGDGCLMEGVSQESIALAGHLKLKKLCVIWDDNGISIDGAISLSDSTDQRKRFEASGWNTLSCDGHDPDAVNAALDAAKGSDKPTLIACRTVIGRGAKEKAGKASSHGAPLGDADIAAAREALGWPHAPFEVPEEILLPWRETGRKGRSEREAWEARLAASPQREEFEAAMAGDMTATIAALHDHARDVAAEAKSVATRKASENALGVINAQTPLTLGGSADLTGSNNTKTKDLGLFSSEDYAGRYVHYGIREHGMAAAMNGLALHGGVVPYGGTFLVFADYMRPSIRIAALMGVRVIYVLTHDSIGLGEDGPTHQPVETLASLRAMPNVAVFRPADAVETAEAWACALSRTEGPSVLALTRQNIGPVRAEADENLTAKGAYVLHEAESAAATIVATGSEVDIALAAKDLLAEEGVAVRVVSMPCIENFTKAGAAYVAEVLGTAPRLVIEAGVRQGWDGVIFAGAKAGDFLGMDGFGASGPYKDLYAHFGITAEAAAEKVRRMITRS